MKDTITLEDGRKMQKPETITFKLHIGEHRNNGYITDELMTVTTPSGWFTGEKIPKPFRKYLQNPTIEDKMGDIHTWKLAAGTHIKPEKLKSMLEKEEDIEITYWRENCGHLDQTRAEIKQKTR